MSNLKNNNGGPAFPVTDTVRGDEKGLTMRDYFAGLIMPVLVEEYVNPKRFRQEILNPLSLAGIAYDFADAMLIAREKGANNE